jgi:hypothetical protein
MLDASIESKARNCCRALPGIFRPATSLRDLNIPWKINETWRLKSGNDRQT